MINITFDFKKRIGRWEFRATARSSNSPMGRFGGGWQWKVGVQWGGSTIIFSLLIMEIIIRKAKK